MGKRENDDLDDAALFREAIGPVRELPAAPEPPRKAPPRPLPRMAARDAGHGCVRIVHGKGLHSDSGIPVLKNLVDRMLRQRADVLAFHSAPAAQGGNGAVLVLLKR